MAISEGRKAAKVVDLQFGTASTGTDQVALSFEILDGPDVGEFITWIGYLTDAAAKHALKALAICGAPQGKTLDQLTVEDLQSLASIVVEYEANNEGKRFPKVKWVNRPGGGGFKMKHQIEGADLRKLGAQFKADFDQTERYEPIPIPEPTAKPAQAAAPSNGAEPPPMTPGSSEPHPFAPGGAGDRAEDNFV